MKYAGYSVASFLTFLVFVLLLVQAPSATEEWKIETIDQGGDYSFAQLELLDGNSLVAYKTGNGTFVAKKNSIGFPIIDSLYKKVLSPDWEVNKIDGNSSSGGYLSLKIISENPALAYQNSELGEEKLVYSKRIDGSWRNEIVDSVSGTGLGTGMYTSLTSVEGNPVILYHTSQDNQFVKATKNGNEWRREVLGYGEGWFVSTDSCGDKALALYRSRETKNLRKAVITESGFEPSNMSYTTNSMPSVDASSCHLRGGIFDSQNQEVVFLNGSEREIIGAGSFSTISIEYQNKPLISYYVQGEGLVYSERTSEGWSEELVERKPLNYTGRYNDLEIDSSGNPGIVYTMESKIKIAKKKFAYSQSMQIILLLFGLLSGILAFAFAIKASRKSEIPV